MTAEAMKLIVLAVLGVLWLILAGVITVMVGYVPGLIFLSIPVVLSLLDRV